MNISLRARLTALLVSAVITIVMFDAVASLSQPMPEPAAQLASVAATPAR